MRSRFAILAVMAAVLPAGCTSEAAPSTSRVLRLAVTTSTRDSGLMDILVPAFEQQHSARVNVIAAGTGKALKLGESGEVDLVIVHSRSDEDAFMEAGHGIRREDVMYNSFEIVGPPADPAGMGSMEAANALRQIAVSGSRFLSRGDNSGTHKRELLLWEATGGRPEWDGYVEVGQGMGRTLTMADQMQGYALTDRGTWMAMRKSIDLIPLAAPSAELRNPYGIIVVDPGKNDLINARLATAFVDFIISPQAQRLIMDFKVQGESLFYPLRLPDNESP